MHAACLEAEVPGSVSKFESVQGATVVCVTPGTRSDSGRFAHSHAQRLMTLCISRNLIAEVGTGSKGRSYLPATPARGSGLETGSLRARPYSSRRARTQLDTLQATRPGTIEKKRHRSGKGKKSGLSSSP